MNRLYRRTFGMFCHLPCSALWALSVWVLGMYLCLSLADRGMAALSATALTLFCGMLSIRLVSPEGDAASSKTRVILTGSSESSKAQAQIHIVTLGRRRDISQRGFEPFLQSGLALAADCGIRRVLLSSPLLGADEKLKNRVEALNSALRLRNSPWRAVRARGKPSALTVFAFELFCVRLGKAKRSALCDDDGRLQWGRIILKKRSS
jgi:hypothetical protein